MAELVAPPAYLTLAFVRDVWGFLRPYRLRFAFVTLTKLAGDIARLYPSIAIAQIISYLGTYQAGASLAPVWRLVGFAALAHLIHISGRQTARIIGFRLAERLALEAQFRTIQHLFLVDLAWHERENSGNKLKRMQRGGEALNTILRRWIDNAIDVTVTFVGISIVLSTFDGRLSLAMIGFVAVYILISRFFMRRASALSQAVNIAEEDMQGLAFEAVNNIRSVKVLGMSSSLEGRIGTQMGRIEESIRRRIFWYQSRDWVLVLYANGFALTSLGLLAMGVASGRYELGLLVLFVEYFRMIWQNIERLESILLDVILAKFSVQRMMDMLHEPVRIDQEEGKREFPVRWKAVELRNVSFGYSDDRQVLQDVSFTINRGEKIGIVGLSGAGKSTLFKLLLKEHEGYTGDILIGGTKLRDIRRTSYFRHSAVVLQDTEVFNFTLRDNITLANPDELHNDALLGQAIETAHVTDFLDRLPEGLDTLIGEKGIKLSGGEKQRVGIARAVFKQPHILFLDEATSHLDVESEEKIRDSLHCFFQQVTAVVIAHRLSTIKEMDRIIVLEHGGIVEQGTFQELYDKKGRFHELWEKQKF